MKQYVSPEAKFIKFEAQDIIATSDVCDIKDLCPELDECVNYTPEPCPNMYGNVCSGQEYCNTNT